MEQPQIAQAMSGAKASIKARLQGPRLAETHVVGPQPDSGTAAAVTCCDNGS